MANNDIDIHQFGTGYPLLQPISLMHNLVYLSITNDGTNMYQPLGREEHHVDFLKDLAALRGLRLDCFFFLVLLLELHPVRVRGLCYTIFKLQTDITALPRSLIRLDLTRMSSLVDVR